MVKTYSREPPVPKKACKASGSDLKVHFKNTFEVGKSIRRMGFLKAKKYMKDVLAHKRCVPFTRYKNHVGRTAQAKEFGGQDLGRWPEKSVKIILGLLQNLEANANIKGLDLEKLIINHVQVNKAQRGRRRTYRAHGRINPFMNSPCHVEIWASEKDKDVKKEANKGNVRLNRKQIARKRLRVGEN